MNRLLVVNADDYGLTEGISRGILRAHRDGIVTSTSVIAVGPAFALAAPWLDEAPDLAVGIHLAAVGEDPPLLAAREIPTIVDRRGRFAHTWKRFAARAAAGRVDPDDVRREFSAQLERVRDLGRPITHLDAHQHLHLLPLVRAVVLELALVHGVAAVRVPRVRPVTPVYAGVAALAGRLARRARRVGLGFTDDAVGIEVAGRLDAAALERSLRRLAARGRATAELTVHPGEPEDPERHRYAWGYRWPDELATLVGAGARAAVARHGFTLATYADVAPGIVAPGVVAPVVDLTEPAAEPTGPPHAM